LKPIINILKVNKDVNGLWSMTTLNDFNGDSKGSYLWTLRWPILSVLLPNSDIMPPQSSQLLKSFGRFSLSRKTFITQTTPRHETLVCTMYWSLVGKCTFSIQKLHIDLCNDIRPGSLALTEGVSSKEDLLSP